MSFPVCVDLVHEFLCIPFCLNGHFFLYSLFEIGIGFDMGSVHEYNPGSYIPGLHHFHENPTENLVNGFGSKAMTEVIADG